MVTEEGRIELNQRILGLGGSRLEKRGDIRESRMVKAECDIWVVLNAEQGGGNQTSTWSGTKRTRGDPGPQGFIRGFEE